MSLDEQVSAVVRRWGANLNTLLVVIGFAGGLIAWGYTLNDIQVGRKANEKNIEALTSRISTNETMLRKIDIHELRLSNVEKNAVDTAGLIKSLDSTLNGLAADMKVTKEIMMRIEAAQKARFQP